MWWFCIHSISFSFFQYIAYGCCRPMQNDCVQYTFFPCCEKWLGLMSFLHFLHSTAISIGFPPWFLIWSLPYLAYPLLHPLETCNCSEFVPLYYLLLPLYIFIFLYSFFLFPVLSSLCLHFLFQSLLDSLWKNLPDSQNCRTDSDYFKLLHTVGCKRLILVLTSCMKIILWWLIFLRYTIWTLEYLNYHN